MKGKAETPKRQVGALTNRQARSSIIIENRPELFRDVRTRLHETSDNTTTVIEATMTTTRNETETERATAVSVEQLDSIQNPNVRRVALEAQALKENLERNPKQKLCGTYSEAYSGEQA